MKKRLLPFLLLVLCALCVTSASADSIDGKVTIASVYDAYGRVDALTDGSTATTWGCSIGSDTTLTLNLYGDTVGEIWLRSGHCYSQNYFNHYDRPEIVKVTVYYRANQYTTSSDSYRYRLSDAYRPSTVSSGWNDGYQRLLLPKAYQGVTKIELTIESAVTGSGYTGSPTLTDIIVARGHHATATPKANATRTPKPYVVYVTATPKPYDPDDYVEFITPVPKPDDTEDDYVEYLTPAPRPDDTEDDDVAYITPAPRPTEPLVELITPVPRPTEEPRYPSSIGIIGQLKERIATRSGPGTWYDEPGSFFGKGDYVSVITKAWDEENGIWWFQVEFQYDGEWYRAYTPASRIDLNPGSIPSEDADIMNPDSRRVLYDQRVYFGPGEEYKMYKVSMLYEGSKADLIYAEELNGEIWALVHYFDYATDEDRRGWVPMEALSKEPFTWD